MGTDEWTASAGVMNRIMNALLRYPSVTQLSQWNVFFKVGELDSGRGVRQSDLNNAVGMSRASVTRALDVLDDKVARIGDTRYPDIGLVRREENFGAAGNLVYLTDIGKGLLRIIASLMKGA